ENQVTAGVVDLTASDSECVAVVAEPESVIKHEPREILGRAGRRPSGAAHTAPILAAEVHGQRRCALAQQLPGVIEVFELNAVIRVDALAVGISQRVRAPIVVRNDRKRAVGTPQDLPSHAGSLVELPVRLPSVDDPGLDLQLVARIDLNP